MNINLLGLSWQVLVLRTLMTSMATAQQGALDGQWLAHGGGKGAAKYAPLDQITPDNFGKLEVAWTWDSIDADVTAQDGIRVRPQRFESTPLMANGVLYTSTSFSQVAAVDAGTGETIWKYDTGSWQAGRPANIGFIHRGVSYWKDGDDERVFIATGHSKLIALNAKTGQPISSFGEDGYVNLLDGLNRPGRVGEIQVNSPGMIVQDVIVLGSVVMDRPSTKEYVRGDIRGFDVRTGEKLWTFHSIPQEGEFGNETWEDGSWKYTGSTNAWSVISGDEELGYVYIPFGAATNDFYGGHRPGDNLFATSLVCLNAKSGKRVWHFQTVHHDLWDYDIPAAPNLIDVVVDGKPIKAVAQISKTAFVYVFDRATGEPVWPIEERPVPQSNFGGEKTSPTQPFPTKPAPFAMQGLIEENIIDFTPEIRAEALEIVKEYGFAPIFTPPNGTGVFSVPFNGGGGNWMGAAFDPETGILYVPGMVRVDVLKLTKPDPSRSNMDWLLQGMPSSPRGPSGLPLVKPPYSHISAIDMNTGEHVWKTPVGKGIEDHPRLKGLNIPHTGGGFWAYPMATKTLVLGGKGSNLLFLDKASGEYLGKFELRDADGNSLGGISGAPMTYMHNGKQYVVAAVTTTRGKGTLVAVALP